MDVMNSLSSDLNKLIDTIVTASGAKACDTLREPLAEIRQRLSTIERRLAILENVERTAQEEDPLARSAAKICEQCDRRAVARGLCSAHYQQWRYRSKKAKVRDVRTIVPGAVIGSVLGKVPSANVAIDDNGERHELNA